MKKIYTPSRKRKFNWHKLGVNVFLSVVFLAGGFIFGSHLYTQATLDKVIPIAFAKEEPMTMREWVLKTVKNAEINENEAYMIIWGESKWKTDAVNINSNGTFDAGLWQINSIHKDISNADKFDYKKATLWAIAKYKKDGNSWRAWTVSKKYGLK